MFGLIKIKSNLELNSCFIKYTCIIIKRITSIHITLKNVCIFNVVGGSLKFGMFNR